MGAVYSIEGNLRYKSETDIVNATKEYINQTTNAKFSDTEFSNIYGALAVMFTKNVHTGSKSSDTYSDTISFYADFNASYGWESVMTGWFDFIAPYLENASILRIAPDTGSYYGEVRDGKVVWSDLDDEDEDDEDEDDEYDDYDDEDEDATPGMQVDDPELQKAIDYINEFTEDEYGDIAINEGDDLSDIGIMFTYAGDEDEYVTEVSVDLINYTISYFVNGEMVDQDKFSSISEMNDTLNILSFDWLYHACCRHIDWDEDDEE